jgi:nicotinic acid mononucleotide adenylyltransferase
MGRRDRAVIRTLEPLAFSLKTCHTVSMIKNNQMRYACAATFGRFNLPHIGHAELVEQMLAHADYADVHISGSGKNNEYELRELLFKVILRNRGVDMSRVRFYQTPNVNEALEFSVKNAPYNEVVFVLGSDQVDMLYSLSDVHDVNYVINHRSNSSTQMRYFLDSYDFLEDAKYLYEDCAYATTIAYMLRAEEHNREKSYQASAKTHRAGKACSNTKIGATYNCSME